MKKITKSILCTASAALMILSAAPLASADSTHSVPVRIEGVDGNIFYETVTVEDADGKLTAAEVLIAADDQHDDLTIKGAESGYITDVNGTAAAKFGGYDGWYYCVNNEVPSVGVNEFEIKDGDSLTLYYGGFPCQIPYADLEKIADGVIVFKSNDTEYDENWNATSVVKPVENAEVTVDGKVYTTDKNGSITLDSDTAAGSLSVQISKKDSSGAPCVLRFAPDYTISYAPAAADTESDSDVNSDRDTDSAADTDSETKSSTPSSQTSSQQSTTTAATTTATAARTTTTAATVTSAPAQAAAPAATGDGRTYTALAVFGGAAIILVTMFLLGRKKED